MAQKTINKSFGEVLRVDEESRKVIFTASTTKKDRHGTILNQEGWDLENFNRNPVIGYNHEVYGGSDPDDIIGTGRAWVEDGALMLEVDFEPAEINPKAEKIFRKVQHGTLKAVSVGFIPTGRGRQGDEKRGEDPTAYYFEGQELLEVSVVNIPSNPEAVKRSLDESAVNYVLNNLAEIGEETRKELREKLADFKTAAEIEHEEELADQHFRDLMKLRQKRLDSYKKTI